jgi:hypothetical protein
MEAGGAAEVNERRIKTLRRAGGHSRMILHEPFVAVPPR